MRKGIKTCSKRHPRNCKNYFSGNCKFKSDCCYHHQEQIPEPNEEHLKLVQKINELKKVVQKVNELEKVVQAQNRMVLKMEEEITELKKKNVASKGVDKLNW